NITTPGGPNAKCGISPVKPGSGEWQTWSPVVSEYTLVSACQGGAVNATNLPPIRFAAIRRFAQKYPENVMFRVPLPQASGMLAGSGTYSVVFSMMRFDPSLPPRAS